MHSLFRYTCCLSLLFISLLAAAQPPRGGRPGGRGPGNPEEFIAREKQALYTKITDLSEDQKILIEGIYDEFAVTLKETFEEFRESGNREGRREKMQALRAEKDELMADVLNPEQFETYKTLTSRRRGRRPRTEDPNGQ